MGGVVFISDTILGQPILLCTYALQVHRKGFFKVRSLIVTCFEKLSKKLTTETFKQTSGFDILQGQN